jgi:hypothetical protein
MLRALWCIPLSLFLLASTARAAIHIAPECRVKNRPPGRCGWCALETLARHHGVKAVYGFADRHPCTCSPRSLEAALQETGVRYRMQYPGCRNRSILHYAIEEELGAAIGLRAGAPTEEHGAMQGGVSGHIVVLVDLAPDMVRFLDPNDADGRTRTMSLRRFLARWDGLAVVLVPDGKWVRTPPYPPQNGGGRGGHRSRAMTAAMRRAASSMSSMLNSGLRLKRIAECSTAAGTPIACSTGEGRSEPLEQAEPVEQATPAKSRFINKRSAFTPGKDTLIVCGMPSSGPLRTRGAASAFR